MAIETLTSSIAMATHNGRAFIEEQLRSISSQSRLPDELVISDDCSDDGTIEVLKDFATKAPFTVRVHVNEQRLGYAQNFDRALRDCRGQVVFLSDQDDVWMPNKIERVLAEFMRNPNAGLLIHDCVITDKMLAHSGTTRLGNLRRMRRSFDNHVSGCCTALKFDLLEVLLPIPLAFGGHDAWLHQLAQMLDQRLVLDEPLIFYRRHGRNVSRSASDSSRPVSQIRGTLLLVAKRLEGASPRLHHASVRALEKRWCAVEERLALIGSGSRSPVSVSEQALSASHVNTARWLRQTRRRLQILELPRSKRLWAVLAAAFRGTYSGFHVPGSMILDLLAMPTDHAGDGVRDDG